MRRLASLAFAGLMVVGLALAPAATANADQGDGLLSCNTGEICFKKHSGGSNSYLRHFWYSDMSHNDDYFTDQGGVVMDNMSSHYNRDTSCDVNLFDVTSTGGWFVYETIGRRQSGGYWYIGDQRNDRNNGHQRC